jgi:hypothetical protein
VARPGVKMGWDSDVDDGCTGVKENRGGISYYRTDQGCSSTCD